MKCSDCNLEDGYEYEDFANEIVHVSYYSDEHDINEIALCQYCAENLAEYKDEMQTLSDLQRWCITGV